MFTFKLDPLLAHRKHLEELCQKELAALRQGLARETQALHRLRRQRDEQEIRLRGLKEGRPDIAGIVGATAFMARLDTDIGGQEKRVAEAQEACDKQRCELVAAMKGRKIIERLKEKNLEAHNHEERRSQQNFMNELAINRFTRNR